MNTCLACLVSAFMVWGQTEMFAPGIPYKIEALPIYDDPANPPSVNYDVLPLESPAKEAAEALRRKMDQIPEKESYQGCSPVWGMALLNMGPRALPYLFSALRSENPNTRFHAAETFLFVSEKDRALIPVLTQAIQQDAALVRLMAAHALGVIAKEDPEVVPTLIEALDDKNEAVRVCVMSRLQEVKAKPDMNEAVAPVLKIAQEPETFPKAQEVLVNLGHLEEAVADAIERLKSTDQEVQFRAILFLEQLGPDAKEALPVVMELFTVGEPIEGPKKGDIHNGNWANRLHAITLVGCMGKEAISAAPKLIQLLDAKRTDKFAAIALGQILADPPDSPSYRRSVRFGDARC